MVEYDLNRAKKAVQLLVDVSHFSDYVKTLKKNVERPRALPYKDDLEVLNELLIIGRQDVKALDNLIAIAQFKRSAPEEKKNEYQREFMAAKRKRDKAMCQLEEALTGRALSADKRRALLLKQYKRWNDEKDKHLSLCGDISWTERNAVIKDFWYAKDLEVAKAYKNAVAEQAKKVTKKRVVIARPLVREALIKAIDKRR